MNCIIREWKIEDKTDLALNLNNKNILNNLRDGLPYPYTENDAEEYIKAMLSADKTKTFAFANNAASCRVLEKAGFQYEGTLRKNAIKNGEVLDMKMYAMTREN